MGMPYFVYLFMQYRNQIGIPAIYGIRQSDMLIYMMFQIVILFFQPICDALNMLSAELYHGWKGYDYLVYSRYRFLQRETRWKGMEDSLDECIDEELRKLDHMCFSSQYYLMMCMSMNGVICVVFSVEIWIRTMYSPFTDSGFATLTMFLILCYLLMEWATLQLAVYLQVWKIKHESTAWHILHQEEDELDIPGWEDLKGASHEAYIMNQRISSETFRFKFLNYNRTWLINQLPQLLTPRTMRLSRPYLINQFARIINARRDDISDDSDGGVGAGFGPAVLTAPSRNIIRWWLGKAKRRLRLKTIVEPLIRRARGAECEQCLSRKKLQIEYEIDVDTMADMYDKSFPGDEEVDQARWTCPCTTTNKKSTPTGVLCICQLLARPSYSTGIARRSARVWARRAQRSVVPRSPGRSQTTRRKRRRRGPRTSCSLHRPPSPLPSSGCAPHAHVCRRNEAKATLSRTRMSKKRVMWTWAPHSVADARARWLTSRNKIVYHPHHIQRKRNDSYVHDVASRRSVQNSMH